MQCISCGSDAQGEFPAEIAIHFPRLVDINKPHVFLSPTVLICPECGAEAFVVPDAELRMLVNRTADAAESN